MRVKWEWFFSALLILTLSALLTGCGGGSLRESPLLEQNKSHISMSIEWQAFEVGALSALAEGHEELSVTSVGARLEYVEENASFAQSVSRETASTKGVITLEVPPTQKANLFLVAVHENESYRSERALYLGTIHDLVLESGNTLDITLADFDLSAAEWHVEESHWDDYLTGVFVSDRDERWFYLPIYVRDPYQVGQSLSRGNTFVKAAGRSSQRDNTNGWRRIDIASENDRLGESHVKEEWFWPYLDGSLFNLSETYYYIGDEGIYTVHWE